MSNFCLSEKLPLTPLIILAIYIALPVGLGAEYSNDCRPVVDGKDVAHGLEDVKVEEGVSWDRAVESSFQKGGPVLLQDPRRATHVVFAYSGHPREGHLESNKPP